MPFPRFGSYTKQWATLGRKPNSGIRRASRAEINKPEAGLTGVFILHRNSLPSAKSGQ